MTVLDRVAMNVVDMPRIVVITADHVFPVTPLPDAALAFFLPAVATPFSAGQISREAGLDQSPALCKSRIVRRQCPYRMQMVGQDDDGMDMKEMASLDPSHCIAQDIDRIHQQGT